MKRKRYTTEQIVAWGHLGRQRSDLVSVNRP